MAFIIEQRVFEVKYDNFFQVLIMFVKNENSVNSNNVLVSEASTHLPSPKHPGGGGSSVIFSPLGARNADLET